MSSIHELLKQVYPLKLRMELFNAIWFNWRADIKEKDQQITDLQSQLTITEKALELAADYMQSHCPYLATKKEDGNVIVYIDKTDCDNNCSNCIKNHYKQRAKEMLENE